MLSGSEVQFETALSLTTPWFFRIGIIMSVSQQLKFLSNYLKTYHDLLNISSTVQVSFEDEERHFIWKILEKNRHANFQILNDFLLHYAKNSSLLPPPVLIAINKKTLFDTILKLGQKLTLIEQKKLWQRCIDPQTELGERFWRKEGMNQCKETKGKLALIHQEITNIDKKLALKAKPEFTSKSTRLSFFNNNKKKPTEYKELHSSETILLKEDQKKHSIFPNLFKAAKVYQEQIPGSFYTNDTL